MLKHIYNSALTEVIFLKGVSKYIVVSFTEKNEPPPAKFFGSKYFKKRSINAVILRTRKNIWWLSADVKKAIQAVKTFIFENDFSQIYGYGASMGSYGALQFASNLGFSRIIAMGPVASIDPSIDNRWYSDISDIAEEDRIFPLSVDGLPAGCKTFVLYDPNTPDNKHIDYLEGLSEIFKFPMPFSGHNIPGFLLSAGILSELLDALLEDLPDEEAIRLLIENSNDSNWRYLHALADSLRNDNERFIELCTRAVCIAPSEPLAHYKLAQALCRSGKIDRAVDHLRFIEDPDSNWLLTHNFADAATEFIVRGGDPQAIDDLFELFRSDRPRSRQSQLAYSRYLRVNKRFEEAFKAHEQFLKDDAFSAHAYYERGLIFEEQGNESCAKRQYELAQDANPWLPRYREALERLQAKTNKGIS